MNDFRLYPWPVWIWWVAAVPAGLTLVGIALALSARRDMLVFDGLEYWWLLVGAGLAALLFLYATARRRRAMEAFASRRLAPLLVSRGSCLRPAIRAGLMVTALLLITMGIVGPRWGVYVEKQRVYGRDIVVAIDVSRSMLAEDVKPNRFQRARQEIRQQLIERGAFAQNNRLALLAFSGSTSLRLPLTTDTLAFRRKLEELQVGVVPRGGTAIGEAIRAGADLLAKSPQEATRMILLFTDGEDHEGEPVLAAKEAWEQKGIRVFTIGVGDPASTVGAQVPSAAGSDKPMLHDGQIVFSKLNVEALREVAAAGGGDFVALPDLFRLVNKIAGMKKAELSAEERMRHRPRYQWFILAALAFLFLETIIREHNPLGVENIQRVWQIEAAR